jgi:Domain of unknown function (DUF4384)
VTNQLPARTRTETCLSDLAIERFLVGEPPDQSDPPTETHLLTCELCQRRRDELAAAPEQVPDQLWWQQQAATAPRRRQMRSVLGLGGGAVTLAAAAALVLAIRTKPFAPAPAPAPAAATRAKGGDFLLEVVARHADGKTEHVFEDTVLHPRDRIQFGFTSQAGGHVAVVGLDAAGSVSVYFPDEGASHTPFPSGTHELPVSITLDETLGAERIVALLCPEPPAPAALIRAGRNALARAPLGGTGLPGGLALPEGLALNDPSLPFPCRQSTVTIHKEREPR